MTKNTFEIVKSIKRRGPIDQLPDNSVNGLLMVGNVVMTYTEYDRAPDYGHDNIEMMPAVYNGKKVWLLRHIWESARGYCAVGVDEKIIPYEEGIKIMIDQEYYGDMHE